MYIYAHKRYNYAKHNSKIYNICLKYHLKNSFLYCIIFMQFLKWINFVKDGLIQNAEPVKKNVGRSL